MSKQTLGPWNWAVHESHGDDEHVLPSLIDAEGNEVLWLGDSANCDKVVDAAMQADQ